MANRCTAKFKPTTFPSKLNCCLYKKFEHAKPLRKTTKLKQKPELYYYYINRASPEVYALDIDCLVIHDCMVLVKLFIFICRFLFIEANQQCLRMAIEWRGQFIEL